MRLYVTNSGSDGNNYVLESGNGRKLLLDLGCPVQDIKKTLKFNISNIDGCLVTHSHSDHSKSSEKFEKMGFPVWKPYLDKEKKIDKRIFGDFKVTSFDVPHDGTENRGFLIEVDGEKILYATDFEYIPYNFKKQKINHLIIECNYISDFVQEDSVNRNHVYLGHCEVETTKGVIQANETDELKSIVLVHLSKENSFDDEILKRVKEITDKPITVAKKGMVIDLSEIPF